LFQIVGSFQTFTFHKVMYRQGVMRPLMISSLHDLCRVRRWKKTENRSTFAEVMGN